MVKVSMVVFVAAASVAVAQPQAQSQGELQQLRQEAQRLMVLQALPEEAQAEAEGLLEQQQTLSDAAMTLRTERLQALVDALEAGEAPMVARELADQAVSDARLALLRDAASFREDMRAFVDTYPAARGTLGRLGNAWQDDWQRGWDEDTNFGAGNQYGNQPGMMQRGNQPGMMQRGSQPGQSGQSFGNRHNMGQYGGQYGQGYGQPNQGYGSRQNLGQYGQGYGQPNQGYGSRTTWDNTRWASTVKATAISPV